MTKAIQNPSDDDRAKHPTWGYYIATMDDGETVRVDILAKDDASAVEETKAWLREFAQDDVRQLETSVVEEGELYRIADAFVDDLDVEVCDLDEVGRFFKRVEVTLDPEEPACDGRSHRWIETGARGKGVTVYRTSRCSVCGCERVVEECAEIGPNEYGDRVSYPAAD